MARSFDIASFEPGDGVLNEQLRRKLNGNFRRLCEMVGTESPAVVTETVAGGLMDRVPAIVDASVSEYMEAHLEDILGAAMDRSWPVGSVIVTSTASDPRLSHGTWQQVGSGRYVRAAGNGVPVMSEGGESEVTLTVGQMPYGSGLSDAVGSGQHTIPVVDQGHAQDPVPVEPEYVALLFYRRTQ